MSPVGKPQDPCTTSSNKHKQLAKNKPVKMSLSTLLEAAKYLEMQEQQQQQQEQRAAETAASTLVTSSTQSSTVSQLSRSQPKTLVITSEVAQAVIQAPLTTAVTQAIRKELDHQQPVVTSSSSSRHRLHNSFDIMNPLVIDESNNTSTENKRRQPPMAFRAGTREVHNKLEKHRRAHLKECFDYLKKQLPPNQDEKKSSNLNILHSALKYIQALKRRERELEHEMERLARDKIAYQQRLAVMKKESSEKTQYDNVDLSKLLPEGLLANGGGQTSSGSEEIINRTETITSGTGQNTIGRVPIPLLPSKTLSIATTQMTAVKEVPQQQPVQATALSVVPVGYPMSQGLVVQKLAIVPKGLTDLTPLMPTHFITQQQLNGKVVPVPLVNAQYVVKPVVVVSRPS